MEFLHIENFKKSFSDTEVLKGIDFDLPKGKILAIIGASGGGKTTLMRCLNFLETPDEGKIFLDGQLLFDANQKYSDKELRKKRLRFSLVFQSFNLFPHYRAIKNVTLAAELLAKEDIKAFKKQRKEFYAKSGEKGNLREEVKAYKEKLYADIKANAEQMLESVGLADKRDSYPYELSGGQQQRLAIVRALALSPDVLCFDEPTSALDPELTQEVLNVIKSLKGHTMIIVTHEMAFARDVADLVLFLADGNVEEFGTPEQVFGNPKSEKTKAFLKFRQNNELTITK